MKKGDLSKIIDEGARRRVFQQTLQEARARNAHVPPEQLQEAIEEALAEGPRETFRHAPLTVAA